MKLTADQCYVYFARAGSPDVFGSMAEIDVLLLS